MKTKKATTLIALVLLALCALPAPPLFAQGSTFTYQGQLNDAGTRASGTYDLQFSIYDIASGGNPIAGPLTNLAVTINQGMFTATLDFGAIAFDGSPRWLEIGVRTNGGGAFSQINPRQLLTATPYAIVAGDVTGSNVARLDVPNTARTATGHPIVTSGFITDAIIDNHGSGYVTTPTVTVNANGPGSGAVITATIAGGSVTALTVVSAGSGYTGSPTLTIGAPPPNNYQTFASTNYFPGVNFLTNSANIFAGNGSGLSGLWKLGGNAAANPATGSFLGTTDNLPFELKVNGTRTLRLDPAVQPNMIGAPNIIGGSANNFVYGGVVGATISGGGAENYFNNHYTNGVTGSFGTVSGGGQNLANTDAVVGGGLQNSAIGSGSTVSGGEQNTSTGSYSAIGGGYQNKISQSGSVISGGAQSSIELNATDSVIAGGLGNTNRGPFTAIGGGLYSLIHSNAYYATVGGGAYNTIGTNSSSTTISGGYDNTIFENTLDAVIGGGSYNSVGTNSQYSTIAGGRINTVSANSSSSAIGGGFVNKIDSNSGSSTISGGQNNFIATFSPASFIGGGSNNVLRSSSGYSFIGGGASNTVQTFSSYSFIGGGQSNTMLSFSPLSFIGGGSSNTLQGNLSVIAGGEFNQLYQTGAVIGGGILNTNWSGEGTIAGGLENFVNGNYNTVSGGYANQAIGTSSTVGGGYTNLATGDDSTIAGGHFNSASGLDSTVGGGINNVGNGPRSVVAGGYFNTASGNAATVPGGSGNVASGTASFAAGRLASAAHDGCFVWADYAGGAFSSTGPNQFAVHATGGVHLNGDVSLEGDYRRLEMTGGNALGYLYGSYPALGDGIHLGYNYYYDAGGNGHPFAGGGATSRVTVGYGFVGVYISTSPGASPTVQRILANSSGVTVNGTFNNSSDRNAKQDFKQVDSSKILAKVAELPLTEWSYKDDPNTRHIGPMGQDFYSLFNVGTDEKHIAPIDEGGVALAAIQALNQKLEDKDNRITKLEKEIAELKNLLLSRPTAQ